MALLKNHENINYHYQLWEIDNDLTKSESSFQVLPKYHPNIKSYKNHFRINQILNTRRIVKELVGENVELIQNRNGKPILLNSDHFISISNHKNIIAVMIAKFSCGIDVESQNRNLTKIQHKFINHQDFSMFNNNDLSKIWSGKEVLYKIHGLPKINFKKHLRIIKNNKEIVGRCEHDDISFETNLISLIHKDLIVMFNTNYLEKSIDD